MLPSLLCPQPEIPHPNASIGHFPKPDTPRRGKKWENPNPSLIRSGTTHLGQHHVVDFVFGEGKAVRCCRRCGSQ
jgi:hypothetical protein